MPLKKWIWCVFHSLIMKMTSWQFPCERPLVSWPRSGCMAGVRSEQSPVGSMELMEWSNEDNDGDWDTDTHHTPHIILSALRIQHWQDTHKYFNIRPCCGAEMRWLVVMALLNIWRSKVGQEMIFCHIWLVHVTVITQQPTSYNHRHLPSNLQLAIINYNSYSQGSIHKQLPSNF